MTIEAPNPAGTGGPDLWSWSLATYGRPGFSAAAVGLQDGHGLDVNILLFCLWAGLVHGSLLGEAGVRAALVATGAWQQDVVLPLRAVRRLLKGRDHPDPELVAELRRRVAADELEAERGEQALLAALPLPGGRAADRLAAAAGNLRCYRSVAGVTPGPALDGLLARILALAAGLDEAAAARSLAVEP